MLEPAAGDESSYLRRVHNIVEYLRTLTPSQYQVRAPQDSRGCARRAGAEGCRPQEVYFFKEGEREEMTFLNQVRVRGLPQSALGA